MENMSKKTLAKFKKYAERTNTNWIEAAIKDTASWKVTWYDSRNRTPINTRRRFFTSCLYPLLDRQKKVRKV